MAGLHVPLLTLRNPPCGWPRIARGRSGSLLLDRTTLAFATPRRLTRRYSPTPCRRCSGSRNARASASVGRSECGRAAMQHPGSPAPRSRGALRSAARLPDPDAPPALLTPRPAPVPAPAAEPSPAIWTCLLAHLDLLPQRNIGGHVQLALPYDGQG